MTDLAIDPGFGIYVHWPYCSRICPYCDFNVYAAKQRDVAPLVEAVKRDILGHRDRTGPTQLTSVYFGGGTPSLMPVVALEAILGTIDTAFGLAPSVEVTLETNPNEVEIDRLAAWRALSINRLSLGVQSLSEDALSFLGRDHDVPTAQRAVDLALAQFPTVSIDLIYARPNQTPNAWSAELGDALALRPHHVSLYELTIEQRTVFGKRAARGDLLPMDDDAQADLYDLTQALMEDAGYPAYEISNHAADAYRSVHNFVYWRSGDWLGIGPGAHGRLTLSGQRYPTEAEQRPGDYIEMVRTTGVGWRPAKPLTPSEWANEVLALGLRTTEGVSRQRLESIAHQRLDGDRLKELQTQGLIEPALETMVLTRSGRLLADRIGQVLAF